MEGKQPEPIRKPFTPTSQLAPSSPPEEVPPDKKLVTLMGTIIQQELGTSFVVDHFYELTQIIGSGVYGVVAKGTNKLTGRAVAIKKQSDIFHNPIDAKRILRELHILSKHQTNIEFLCHKNIISLQDILRVGNRHTFNEVYLVMELMESNLSNVIRSKNVLSEDHIRYFIYQLFCGIHFMHSASIVHRDLKPENIFVNRKCELKIGDLNMARKLEEEDQFQTQQAMQQFSYVITRWYRAPEVLLSTTMYTKAVDIWSAGCILAELIGRVPLFNGNNYMDQFLAIVAVMGRPSPEDFDNDPNVTHNISQLVKGVPQRGKINFKELFPNVPQQATQADDQCLDLLDHMLEYNPKKRYTVQECLNHPYLEKYSKLERQTCTTHFDFSFDKLPASEQVLRQQIYNFACEFRVERQAKEANDLAENSLRMTQSISIGSTTGGAGSQSGSTTKEPKTSTSTVCTKRQREHTLNKEDKGPTKLQKSESQQPSTTLLPSKPSE